MPECVSSWLKYKDPAKVTNIQRESVELYEHDFSKHNGKVNIGRILMVFRSLVRIRSLVYKKKVLQLL